MRQVAGERFRLLPVLLDQLLIPPLRASVSDEHPEPGQPAAGLFDHAIDVAEYLVAFGVVTLQMSLRSFASMKME